MDAYERAATSIERIATQSGFSGAVRVARHGRLLVNQAWGHADRAHEIPNSVDTLFAIASGTKGFTALTVMSLIAEGKVDLTTSVRDVLGDAIESIDPAVEVGHLLAHTSGIGDYLDESVLVDINDYVMPVPVHTLATTRDFLAVLGGFPMEARPGERFKYCNGGYVVLALVAEAVTGESFHDLVGERVFAPAGMKSSFPRSDELPGLAAIGYVTVDGEWRTNHLHLPVRGTGDGGAYCTLEDMSRFWDALFDGRIVPSSVVAEMTRAREGAGEGRWGYGLGFWLQPDSELVMLEGYDAGVWFRSACTRDRRLAYTVVSNTSEGAWPLAKLLEVT